MPRRFSPCEDFRLLDYGYGLTNIVAKPTRAASDLTKDDYREGKALLMDKLAHYKPKVACYVGKGVYEQLTKNRPIPWGPQPNSLLSATLDYVAPSSSGLVRMPFAEMVEIYAGLKNWISSK